MKYVILFFALIILCPSANADSLEFKDWFGIFDDKGNKNIVGFSGSDKITLTVYVDEQYITRLQFNPGKKIRLVTFDGRTYKMNYNSLFGYEHWIKKMKKHYRMRVWFEGEERCEIFSLKGFAKAANWLYD